MKGKWRWEEVTTPPCTPVPFKPLPTKKKKNTLTQAPEGDEEAARPQTTQRDGDRQTDTDRHEDMKTKRKKKREKGGIQ